MKLVIWLKGEIKTFDLERSPDAYFQGDSMHPGYRLKDADDFIPDDGEYLSFSLAMSMYEGAEAAGSYTNFDTGELDWSWALLPETSEENEHLRQFCPRTLFRPSDTAKDEDDD